LFLLLGVRKEDVDDDEQIPLISYHIKSYHVRYPGTTVYNRSRLHTVCWGKL